ncbi:hypothetical protein GVAV_003074 [Gurleya vavrai]
MEKSYEDNNQQSSTGKILGFGTFGLSLVAIAITYGVSWWFNIGIKWHWYLFIGMFVLLGLQLLFTFFMHEKGKFIQPALFFILLINIFLVFWFGSYQVFIGADLNEFKGELKDFKTDNKVYVFITGEDKELGTAKAKVDNKKLKKTLDEAFKKEKLTLKTGKDDKYYLVDVGFDDLETKEDAEALLKTIKGYAFTSQVQRGFINVSAAGLKSVIKEKVEKEEDFIKILKEKAGKEHVKPGPKENQDPAAAESPEAQTEK